MSYKVCVHFEGCDTFIYSNYNDKIDDIVARFCAIKSISSNSISFLYSGKTLDKEEKLGDIIHKSYDNTIHILAFRIETTISVGSNFETDDKYTLKINHENKITKFEIDPIKILIIFVYLKE